MYRHEASSVSLKASRPPSRSSAELAAVAQEQAQMQGGAGTAHNTAINTELTTGQANIEALLGNTLQPPSATNYAVPLQSFEFGTGNTENLFGPGNNDFDGLFQQLLSQDLTDFSMPLFWQQQQ